MSSSQRDISGSTEFVGVIGDPVAHSLSPRLHNAAYEALGLDLRYGAFRVPAAHARAAIAGARSLGFRGLSVTTPHKFDAARYADQRSADVALLEAANTIVFREGVAVAEVTDGDGLLADLGSACGFDPNGARCAIIGAGGAAKAIILALARAGAEEIVVVNRTAARGEAAAGLSPVARTGGLEEVATAALVVQATSIALGAGEHARLGAAFAAHLTKGQLAVDLTYRPPSTPFLEEASSRGATTRGGLGMLVHQAALQVTFFTGMEAPLAAMWDAVAELGSA